MINKNLEQYYSVPGGISDLEDFSGLKKIELDINKPLESQGIIDSMEAMQFIIYLESKHGFKLSKSDISSINVYHDLIKICEKK